MLIRSQNKEHLINFDNVTEIYTYRNIPRNKTTILPKYETDIICYIGRSEIPIGRYDSEEKAIRVLDMIEKQYLDYCCNYHAQSGVFQMPQNSEVD